MEISKGHFCMSKLFSNFELDRYGLYVRLVRENDAAFILSLRTDPKLSRFIHPTENNEEKQRVYIQVYKEREKLGIDYYFIFFLQGEPVGVARIYNIQETTFTFGSWLFKEGLPYWVSIAGAIIAREFAFEKLGKEKEIEADGTHEDNKGVISFSRMLGMTFDSFKMDDKGKYLTGYMLKEDFEKNKQRFIRTFPTK